MLIRKHSSDTIGKDVAGPRFCARWENPAVSPGHVWTNSPGCLWRSLNMPPCCRGEVVVAALSRLLAMGKWSQQNGKWVYVARILLQLEIAVIYLLWHQMEIIVVLWSIQCVSLVTHQPRGITVVHCILKPWLFYSSMAAETKTMGEVCPSSISCCFQLPFRWPRPVL